MTFIQECKEEARLRWSSLTPYRIGLIAGEKISSQAGYKKDSRSLHRLDEATPFYNAPVAAIEAAMIQELEK